MYRSGVRNKSGFTVVEMAVVMAVVALLAALVIFSLGAWRKSAAVAEVINDLNGVKAAMENTRNFSAGYPSSIPSTFSASATVQLTYRSGNANAYCVEAVSTEQPSVLYHVEAVAGQSNDPVPGAC